MNFDWACESLEEIYYYCGKPKKVDTTNLTAESIALHANTQLDQAGLAQITSEQGPLHAGVLPEAAAAVEEGEKALWSAMGGNQVSKVKQPKPKKEKEEAEELTPKTPKETLSCQSKHCWSW